MKKLLSLSDSRMWVIFCFYKSKPLILSIILSCLSILVEILFLSLFPFLFIESQIDDCHQRKLQRKINRRLKLQKRKRDCVWSNILCACVRVCVYAEISYNIILRLLRLVLWNQFLNRTFIQHFKILTFYTYIFRPQQSSALFFQYNTQLGPPYHILLDTNFINFSIKNKLDIIQNMMECLYAKCTAYITDCVLGELEKLGQKYKLALRIVKDPRFERLKCMHKGTYADDCLVNRVTQVSLVYDFLNNTSRGKCFRSRIAIQFLWYIVCTVEKELNGVSFQHKCYIVATNDKELKSRIRKIPGVPIMYVSQHRYTIERMPDAFGAPK